MADISQLEVNGTTYDICDARARDSLSQYLPLSGGTTTGSIVIKSSNIDRDGADPSSTVTGNSYIFVDQDGEGIGIIRPGRQADGREDVGIIARNENSEGEQVQNGLRVSVAKDGACSYGVDDTQAFRRDLLLAYGANTGSGTSASYISSGTDTSTRLALIDDMTNNRVVVDVYQNGAWRGRRPIAHYNGSKNLVLATPSNAAGATDLRALVAADIPNLSASKITSGTLGVARGGTGITNAGHYVGSATGVNMGATSSWQATGKTVSMPPGAGILIGRIAFTGYTSAGTFRQLVTSQWTTPGAIDTSTVVSDYSSLTYNITPFWAGSGSYYFTSLVVTIYNNDTSANKTYYQYFIASQEVTLRNYQLYGVPIGASF